MRGSGVALIVLATGCRFELPGADKGPTNDAPRLDGPPSNARRKQVTIDPARVTGSHAAFPVWIVLDDDDDLRMRATANGADIHFTRADGMPLAYQIQRWSQAAGDLEAWVRTDLDDNLPTVIELRYGEPATAHAPDAPAVFSSSFAAVWHLEDQLDNNNVADATNQRAGTTQGGLGSSDLVAAQLGRGIDFDGNDDRIQFTSPFTGSGEHTFSAWVNHSAGTGFDSIVTVGNPASNQSRFFHARYLNGVSAGFYSNDHAGSLDEIDGDGWVLLHWTWNPSGRRSRVYRDGALLDDVLLGPGVNTQGTAGHIAYAPEQWGPGGCALNGILDEVRLATAERNAGWIATEFANQSAPRMFYTVGPEQPVP